LKMASKKDEAKIKYNPHKVAALLGFAQKSGHLAAGDGAVMETVKAGKARLVIMAEDVAANSREHLVKVLERKNIPFYVWQDKIHLGVFVGKSPRGALAVLDQNFANILMDLLSNRQSGKEE